MLESATVHATTRGEPAVTLVGMQAPHDSVARQAGPIVWEILTLTPGVAKNLLKEGKKTEKALGSRGPV
jgi:hypothetical protein